MEDKEIVLSAGIVVVRRADSTWHYLLLRAFSYWDFPKGLVEEGEDPLTGAIRETEEETTLKDLTFRWGHVFQETKPYNQGRKIARYYLAESTRNAVALPISEELGKPEHDEYRWVTYDDGSKLVSERVQAILDWAQGKLTHRSTKVVR